MLKKTDDLVQEGVPKYLDQDQDNNEKIFRIPRYELKGTASNVRGLHGLLRPAQVDQDDDDHEGHNHGGQGVS